MAAPVPAMAAVLNWSTPTLTVSYVQNGTLPATQTDTISANDGSAVNVTGVSVTYGAGPGGWLTVFPGAGTTPLAVGLTANPIGLAAGSYTATVTFAAAGDAGSGYTMTFNFNIFGNGGGGGAGGGWTSTVLAANYVISGPGTVPQGNTITAADGSSVAITGMTVVYSAAATGWLTVLPQTGITPLQVTLYPNPAGLLPGTYTATVTYTSASVIGVNTSMTFTLTVQPQGSVGSGGGGGNPPTVTVTPNPLVFGATYPNGKATSQQISVIVSDGTAFTVAAQVVSGPNWLTANPITAGSGGSVTVTADASALGIGTYYGNLLVSAGLGATQVPVTFTVAPTELTPSPASLTFTMPAHFGLSSPQQIQVSGPAGTPFQVQALDGSLNFLLADPPSGVTPAVINVKTNSSSLDPGTYTGTVIFAEGPNYQIPVPITLKVGPAATLGFSPGSLTFNYQTTTAPPATQTLRVNSLNGDTQTYSVTSSVQGGFNNWITLGTKTGTAPGTLSVGADPTGLPAGSYFGTLTITSSIPNSSPEQVNVSLIITGIDRPVISAIANSASYSLGVVTPGEIVTLFGRSLGPPTPVTFALSADGKSIATTLATTKVTFDGVPAPILYASDRQTSVQVPYSVTPPQSLALTNTSIRVQYGTIDAAGPLQVPVDIAVPGIFTVNSAGFGQAVAINQNGTLNGPTSPAPRGSTIAVYVTGDGVTSPKGLAGAITQAAAGPPYAPPAIPVSATVGGQGATVVYADRAPASLSGVMQVNLVVPAGAPQGLAVPVVVNLGPKASQANVTINIQ